MSPNEQIAQWLLEREILKQEDLVPALDIAEKSTQPIWEVLRTRRALNDHQISYLLTRIEEERAQALTKLDTPTQVLQEQNPLAPSLEDLEKISNLGWSKKLLDHSTQVTPIKSKKGLMTELMDELNLHENRPPLLRQYRDFKPLGQGGVGSVYLATHNKTQKRMAVKILAKKDLSALEIERFRREYIAISRLNHPNIINVHDFSFDTDVDGRPIPPFLVMEWIEGINLNEYMKGQAEKTTRLRARMLPLFAQLSDALAHAHERGIIHRDLKPTNILLELKTMRPVIIDFGLAKFDSDKAASSLANLKSLTASGIMIGTPSYMPPEQLFGRKNKISEKVDVWGFIATFFHCLTGELPFAAENVVQQVLKLKCEEARRLKSISADAPEWLDELFALCLSREPEQRPAMADIATILRDTPMTGRIYRELKASQKPVDLMALVQRLSVPASKPDPKSNQRSVIPLIVGAWAAALLLAFIILYDRAAPIVKLDKYSARVGLRTWIIKGTAYDPALQTVKLARFKNEHEQLSWIDIPGAQKGSFEYPLELTIGKNIFYISAVDQNGNESEKLPVEITYDADPPLVKILTIERKGQEVTVRGQLNEKSCILFIGSKKLFVSNNEFVMTINIRPNQKTLQLFCVDQVGHKTERSLPVPTH
jgi:serine/threonine protein kinase